MWYVARIMMLSGLNTNDNPISWFNNKNVSLKTVSETQCSDCQGNLLAAAYVAAAAIRAAVSVRSLELPIETGMKPQDMA